MAMLLKCMQLVRSGDTRIMTAPPLHTWATLVQNLTLPGTGLDIRGDMYILE